MLEYSVASIDPEIEYGSPHAHISSLAAKNPQLVISTGI